MLYVYASDGTTSVEWNDDDPDNWPSSRLEWQPSLSGFYYVKINHWDQYAYGCTTEYGLSVSSDAATNRTWIPFAASKAPR